MKKITITTFLAILLANLSVKSANALMIDGGQISAKISQYVQTVNDTVNKASEMINQAKQMATQGFNLDAIRGQLEKELNNYANSWKRSLLASVAANLKNVGGTNVKQKAYKETRKNVYHQALLDVENKKQEIISDNIERVKAKKDDLLGKLKVKTQECFDKKQAYESTEDSDVKNKKFTEYNLCVSEKKDLENQNEELAASIRDQEKALTKAEQAVDEVSSGKNKSEAAQGKWIDSQEEDQYDIKEVGGLGAGDDWAKKETMEKFVLKEEDYKQFIAEYFYNPEVLGTNTVSAQSRLDRVMRERRFLFVNTAVHLLQVSTTARRAIPKRTEMLNKMFEETPKSPSEIEAMSAYASTRIENAKILLLYAKLLSAKMQYLAARDLLEIEAEKERDTIGSNLGSYILDENYVKDLVNRANRTINTDMKGYTNSHWKK